MVKKIKLDFSKVEERSGWNTRQMPEGIHKMKVVSVEQTEAQDGTDMLVYGFVPADERYKSRRFPYYCKLQQNQLFKLRDLLVASGQTVPKRAANIDIEAPVGHFIAVEVNDATGQYEGRSEINGTYGLDILDDDSSADSADDEDDEEYEVDEDEADVEEDDEEEAEDLSVLSLPELRKRAKPLGIDTVGLKKDALIEAIIEAEEEADEDDEDELDDEDLEDEDLDEDELEDDDEEEEEPAPAPRRRPAAKAAAKPAAKAAAPAARRTVRRR
jgi:hypothetical protein